MEDLTSFGVCQQKYCQPGLMGTEKGQNEGRLPDFWILQQEMGCSEGKPVPQAEDGEGRATGPLRAWSLELAKALGPEAGPATDDYSQSFKRAVYPAGDKCALGQGLLYSSCSFLLGQEHLSYACTTAVFYKLTTCF